MPEKKKPAAKAAPKSEAVDKAALSKAKSDLRAEFNEKFDKLARSLNVDLDA